MMIGALGPVLGLVDSVGIPDAPRILMASFADISQEFEEGVVKDGSSGLLPDVEGPW